MTSCCQAGALGERHHDWSCPLNVGMRDAFESGAIRRSFDDAVQPSQPVQVAQPSISWWSWALVKQGRLSGHSNAHARLGIADEYLCGLPVERTSLHASLSVPACDVCAVRVSDRLRRAAQ